MTPHRIQRKQGWQMPENTVYVGRGSKWGNPFIIGERNLLINCAFVRDNNHAKAMYQRFLEYNPEIANEARDELRGKNLACWCRLDQPCHADVLLELANSNEMP